MTDRYYGYNKWAKFNCCRGPPCEQRHVSDTMPFLQRAAISPSLPHSPRSPGSPYAQHSPKSALRRQPSLPTRAMISGFEHEDYSHEREQEFQRPATPTRMVSQKHRNNRQKWSLYKNLDCFNRPSCEEPIALTFVASSQGSLYVFWNIWAICFEIYSGYKIHTRIRFQCVTWGIICWSSSK